MSEEVIILNPDKLGYKDRGIMEWNIKRAVSKSCICNSAINLLY